MQITTNTTGMEAGLTVAVDKDGRDHCVVVVKGTFTIGKEGQATLAKEQAPLVTCDEYYGDPAKNSVRYECEFAPVKPRVDVIISGKAISPTGKEVEMMEVAVHIGDREKRVRVVGDRRWERGLFGICATPPVPFVEMPLLFKRAFGGSDHTHEDLGRQGSEMRNLIGVGYHKNPDSSSIEGVPLPNLDVQRTRLTWTS